MPLFTMLPFTSETALRPKLGAIGLRENGETHTPPTFSALRVGN